MSYTTGTTHYNLPQTVGSDKRDWFDTNEAFAEVDTALYGAVQDTAQAGLDITALQSDVSTINGKLSTDEGNITTLQGKVSSLESTVASQGTELTDVRRDLQDNIESSHEATATSTHAYAVGDYFFYNDVLYKATAIIGVGDTIVPNTNCTGVTVMSEMENGGATPDASQIAYDNSTSGLAATNVQVAIDELNQDVNSFKVKTMSITSNAQGIAVIPYTDIPESATILSIYATNGSSYVSLSITNFNSTNWAVIVGGISTPNLVIKENFTTTATIVYVE